MLLRVVVAVGVLLEAVVGLLAAEDVILVDVLVL